MALPSTGKGFSKLLADQNIINPQIIKEKITTALLALCFRDSHVLVQFWSPVIVRKRCLLTTLDQPFGLEPWFPDELTISSILFGWSGCCVGVLELVTSSNYVDYAFEVQEVSRALKVVDEENLKCPNLYEDPTFYTQVGDERRQIELDEIFFALKAICNVHDIPLAQTWALSGYGSAVAISGNLEQTCSSFNGNCIGKVCMSTYGYTISLGLRALWGFNETAEERKPRQIKRMSCWKIVFIERDAEYVIELVLPPHNTNEADLQGLMKTVKQQINNHTCLKFGIVSSLQVIGGEIGKQPLLENDRDDDDDVRFSKDQSRAEDSNLNKGKIGKERKRSEKSISLGEISNNYGKSRINDDAKKTLVGSSLRVSRSTLKRICRSYGILRWPYKSGSDKSNSLLKSNQTDVVAVHASEGLTPIVEASSEPLVTTNASHDHTIPTEHGKQSSTLVLHQPEQTNLTAGSAQLETSTKDQFIGNTTAANILKNLTIKATHEDNTVRFPFTISDGLVKLKELIATRFQLSLGSFRLKYEDTDGDMILVACDSDLMGSVGETRQPGNQSVIRLFVLPVVHQSPDA
ncbi:PB1 domain, RWP-RK domain, lambda repressor-like, DNA-binding domain protein [Tanacetum coccineum]